jgi:hypothetical protein
MTTDRRRTPAAVHVMSLRLTPAQSAYVQMIAEAEDVSRGAAVRLMIDRAIDAEPPVPPEAGITGADGRPLPLRQVLDLVEDFTPSGEWLAARAVHGDND